MLQDFVCQEIIKNLPFSLTEEQHRLIQLLSTFVCADSKRKTFVLKGYAGTGKTSIVSSLVKTLQKYHQSFVLMAPTGRAAKVFSAYSGATAYSIHKKIYRQKSLADSTFKLDGNPHKNTLFIVDEASMIYTATSEQMFGSGNLLADLIEYTFSDNSNSLLLLGDDAQLTPIIQQRTPALDDVELSKYGLSVQNFLLENVVRQKQTSSILQNATYLRLCIANNNVFRHPVFKINTPDVERITGNELIEKLSFCYNNYSTEDTIVITRSNKTANIYNRGIRSQVFQFENEIANNDLILITKNRYLNDRQEKIRFIANGDICQIKRIYKHKQLYGFSFAQATLYFEDSNEEFEAKLLLDSLYCDTQASSDELNKRLKDTILEDYQDISNKTERFKALFNNEYYNALQIKFAYAITCHKAQGGQWENVFIEQGVIRAENIGADYYRWLYTAFTRAKRKLYLINFPDSDFEK